MEGQLIIEAFEIIKSDKKYYHNRTILHHNYEAIEGFWRKRYPNKDGFDALIKEFGGDIWMDIRIQKIATQFASFECVGSSNNWLLEQTEEIAKATAYLRYHASLFKRNNLTCQKINCRKHKIEKEICSLENGRKWIKRDNEYSAFKALFYILRQVRNNLFHGSKFSLEAVQMSREKKLVELSAKLTETIIDILPRLIYKSYR